MSSNADVHGFNAGTLVVGTGFTCRIGPIAGQMGIVVKLIAGGTLNIVGASASVFNSNFQTNAFYPVSDGEILSLDDRGFIDFFVTGSTCTFAIIGAKSAGT